MADEELRFDVIARDKASAVFEKVAHVLDAARDAMARNVKTSQEAMGVSDKLQRARDKEADALGKVRTAEAALADARDHSNGRSRAIVAAEERLATVRRDAARVTKALGDAERNEFGRRSGADAGKSFMGGLAAWVEQHGYDVLKFLGGNGGKAFTSGLAGALSNPVIGPALIAATTIVISTVMPALGALAASAFVTSFGLGLAGLGIGFAAQARNVQQIWKATLGNMGDEVSTLATPFENTIIAMALVAQRTFEKLRPYIGAAFKDLAPALTNFGDELGHAFEKLGPMLKPVADATGAVLQALGPALVQALGSFSAEMTKLAQSVEQNPKALADFVRGLSDIGNFLGMTITDLNNADAAFSRLTGGTSAVDAVMTGLKITVYGVIGPFDLLARAVKGVSDGWHWLKQQYPALRDGQNQVTAATHEGSAGLAQMATITQQATLRQLAANDAARAAAEAIKRQTQATNDLITAMHKQSGILLTLREAEINYHQALADASAQINKHRGAMSLNTQAGRDNQTALDKVAQAANDQYDAMLRSNKGIAAANAASVAARAVFVQFAEKMGYTKGQAEALAVQLIDTQKHIDAMHGKTIPITYTISGQNFTLNTKTPSSAGRLAGGGQVSGPGSTISDSIPAMLSNKEWVVRASSAQKYGSRAMASVNAGTATVIPGFAAGGGVDIHGYGAFKSNAQLQDYLTKQFMGGTGGVSPGGGGGAGVQRWRAIALAALAAAGEPSSWIGSLLSRMQRESGGNPNAINNWDSNAAKGTPSIGLMQTIGPTFSAFAGPFAGRGIRDPFANIYAAIRYTVSRYGSGPAGWDRPGGYRKGGWLMPGQLGYNETRKPEAILNHEQLAALGRPIQVNLVLDGKMIYQSLLKVKQDKRGYPLGLA